MQITRSSQPVEYLEQPFVSNFLRLLPAKYRGPWKYEISYVKIAEDGIPTAWNTTSLPKQF